MLLENDGWVYGDLYGAVMSFNDSKTVTFSHAGLSISKNVGYSRSFNVPPHVSGNIKYQAKWIIETRQAYVKYKNGNTKDLYKFKTAKFYEGGFIGVYK